MEWRNRDWIWVVGILIVVIILLIATMFAKNKGVEVNFAIISSAVSIALALVAIFFALKQDSDSRRVNDNLVATLENIIREVGSVKNHVVQITKTDIQEIKEKTYETTKLDEQKSTYTKEEVDSLLQETLSAFSNEVENKVENIKKSVNGVSNSKIPLNLKDAIDTIINDPFDNNFKSVTYVQKKLTDLYGINVSKAAISLITGPLN